MVCMQSRGCFKRSKRAVNLLTSANFLVQIQVISEYYNKMYDGFHLVYYAKVSSSRSISPRLQKPILFQRASGLLLPWPYGAKTAMARQEFYVQTKSTTVACKRRKIASVNSTDGKNYEIKWSLYPAHIQRYLARA